VATKSNQYFPQIQFHPGETLAEKLEELGIGLKEFSVLTDIPEKTIIAGMSAKSSITPEMAIQFEQVLKIPAYFWLNHQSEYNEYNCQSQHLNLSKINVGKRLLAPSDLSDKKESSRKLKLNKNYLPCTANENDEIYPNGIFRFNVTRILEHIGAGKLEAEKTEINTVEWFRTHFRSSVNESHLPSVDVTLPVLQAEIRQDMYEIIDGHHRLEKAYRNNIPVVNSYKLKGELLVEYFIDEQGYMAFVEYWNSKLKGC